MKIDKSVYRYIEYELYHYEQYKKDIETERELILESSPSPPDGQPRGTRISNVTEDKALRLINSLAIAKMEKSVRAIDNTLKRLTDDQKKVFKWVFCDGRYISYKMADDLHVSFKTLKNYKSFIIYTAGRELGEIKD